MSLNLGGSEIIKISQSGKKIEIQAELKKKLSIYLIVDIELQLIESETLQVHLYRWNLDRYICRRLFRCNNGGIWRLVRW